MRKALFIATVAAALWLAPGAFAAGWCGTGESVTDRPDIVTGAQVHAIVATPSDSPDQFGAVANRLQDDVDSMNAWWTRPGPDAGPSLRPGHVPRRRTVSTSRSCACRNRASAYQGAFVLPARSRARSGSAGFGNAYKDYVVYYDGPPVQADVCGTGGGDFDHGNGLAVVWVNGCPDVPSDSVQAHELLHAFGALPAGAPNACTAATDPEGAAAPVIRATRRATSSIPSPTVGRSSSRCSTSTTTTTTGTAARGTTSRIAIFLHHLNPRRCRSGSPSPAPAAS